MAEADDATAAQFISPKPVITAVTKQAEISPTERFVIAAGSFSQPSEYAGHQHTYRTNVAHVGGSTISREGKIVQATELSNIAATRSGERCLSGSGEVNLLVDKSYLAGAADCQPERQQTECRCRNSQSGAVEVRLHSDSR